MQVRLKSKAVLSRMQLTLHVTRRTPHGASRLVQAMSVWSVKTRRALSRHCKDVRVYGHKTTGMLGMSTPPLSLPKSVIILLAGMREHFFSGSLFW